MVKRFATVVALVLGGCVGDPMVACEEAEADVFAWRCEVCPGSSWCPAGEPSGMRSLCTGPAEDLEAMAVAYRCSLGCTEQLGHGAEMCPPHEVGAPWTLEQANCVSACTGGL